jgi:hypothetical protein
MKIEKTYIINISDLKETCIQNTLLNNAYQEAV